MRAKQKKGARARSRKRKKNKNEGFGAKYAMCCGCCCNNHAIEREIEISVSFMILEYNARQFPELHRYNPHKMVRIDDLAHMNLPVTFFHVQICLLGLRIHMLHRITMAKCIVFYLAIGSVFFCGA